MGLTRPRHKYPEKSPKYVSGNSWFFFRLNIFKCFYKYLKNIWLHFINVTAVKTQTLSARSLGKSGRVSLGDVTAHGRIQDWPRRELLGTRLRALHFNTGRARERLLGARGLKRSKRETTVWSVRGSEGMSSTILLNISHIAYIINGGYCWIWLQQGPYVEICLNFSHWNAHALISIEVSFLEKHDFSTFFATKFWISKFFPKYHEIF